MAKKRKKDDALKLNRELIFHAYDSFLTAQTRIFTLSNSTYDYQNTEIKSKQTILLLDDLMQFSIAARRLFDLVELKEFSQSLMVPLSFFENLTEPKSIVRIDESVGFRRIVNTIVHSKEIYFFHDRLGAVTHFKKIDPFVIYRIAEKASRERRWHEYTLEPSIFVVSDVGSPLMFCLSDFVKASVVAAEKIVDVCGDGGIFLELEYRGGA